MKRKKVIDIKAEKSQLTRSEPERIVVEYDPKLTELIEKEYSAYEEWVMNLVDKTEKTGKINFRTFEYWKSKINQKVTRLTKDDIERAAVENHVISKLISEKKNSIHEHLVNLRIASIDSLPDHASDRTDIYLTMQKAALRERLLQDLSSKMSDRLIDRSKISTEISTNAQSSAISASNIKMLSNIRSPR